MFSLTTLSFYNFYYAKSKKYYFVYLRLIIGIIFFCISTHLWVLLPLNPALNLTFSLVLRPIVFKILCASASDSIIDYWRYINILLIDWSVHPVTLNAQNLFPVKTPPRTLLYRGTVFETVHLVGWEMRHPFPDPHIPPLSVSCSKHLLRPVKYLLRAWGALRNDSLQKQCGVEHHTEWTVRETTDTLDWGARKRVCSGQSALTVARCLSSAWRRAGVTLKCFLNEKYALGEIITKSICLSPLLNIAGPIKSLHIIGSPPPLKKSPPADN